MYLICGMVAIPSIYFMTFISDALDNVFSSRAFNPIFGGKNDKMKLPYFGHIMRRQGSL